jgi:glucokinase
VKKKSLPIGRPSSLRHTNAHTVLALLREAGECSRADLVRASGLSAPTVTNVVNDLLAENLIEPLGEGKSSGGRPPDLIRFKAERGCIVALQITADTLFFLLADLNGRELTRENFSLVKQETTPDAICGYIGETLRAILKKQGLTRDHLLALVVGVPAITNVEDGVVLSVTRLEAWRNVRLRAMLNKIVPCLVILENDTNLAAQGEQYRGAAQRERDFVYINIGDNVSAGIILNTRIYHGSQWSAGEIGYLRLPGTTRRPLTIHEFGELETVLSSSGILKSWHALDKKHSSKGKAAPDPQTAIEILNLARAGNRHAEKVVRHHAALVSDIIVNLSLILNPGLILLGGEIGAHSSVLRSVQSELQTSEFGIPRIDAGVLNDTAVLWGAIQLGLAEVPSILLPQSLSEN